MAKAKNGARPVGGLEIRVVKDEKTNTMMINHYYVIGHVGQFAMELFRAEMTSLEPLNIAAGGPASYQSFQRTAVDHCVKRACDGAERMFAEMNRRGWLFTAPTLDEIIEEKTGHYGLHPGGMPNG